MENFPPGSGDVDASETLFILAQIQGRESGWLLLLWDGWLTFRKGRNLPGLAFISQTWKLRSHQTGKQEPTTGSDSKPQGGGGVWLLELLHYNMPNYPVSNQKSYETCKKTQKIWPNHKKTVKRNRPWGSPMDMKSPTGAPKAGGHHRQRIQWSGEHGDCPRPVDSPRWPAALLSLLGWWLIVSPWVTRKVSVPIGMQACTFTLLQPRLCKAWGLRKLC